MTEKPQHIETEQLFQWCSVVWKFHYDKMLYIHSLNGFSVTITIRSRPNT